MIVSPSASATGTGSKFAEGTGSPISTCVTPGASTPPCSAGGGARA